jgi:4'-phosphopantetheinyl transferase EntD
VRIGALDGDPTAALPEWKELVSIERAHAQAASPRRAREFVAGRAALRRALRAAGADDHPSLPGEQGRPQVPDGWTGSITHKDGWAFAAAGRRDHGTLGIDSEVMGRERLAIAPRILRPEELARWRAAGAVWSELLQTFTVKEAIYKALHPRVPRWIGFLEAEITADGSIRMHLEKGEGPFVLASAVERDGDRLLAFVRVHP